MDAQAAIIRKVHVATMTNLFGRQVLIDGRPLIRNKKGAYVLDSKKMKTLQANYVKASLKVQEPQAQDAGSHAPQAPTLSLMWFVQHKIVTSLWEICLAKSFRWHRAGRKASQPNVLKLRDVVGIVSRNCWIPSHHCTWQGQACHP